MSRILNTRDLNRTKVAGVPTKKVVSSPAPCIFHLCFFLFFSFVFFFHLRILISKDRSRGMNCSLVEADLTALRFALPPSLSPLPPRSSLFLIFLNRVINFTVDVRVVCFVLLIPYDRSIGALIVYSYESIELDIHACK